MTDTKLESIELQLAAVIDSITQVGTSFYECYGDTTANNMAIIELFREGMGHIENLINTKQIDTVAVSQLMQPFAMLKQRFSDNVVRRNQIGIQDILARRLDKDVCDLIVVKVNEDQLTFEPHMDNLQRYQMAEQSVIDRFADLGIHSVTGVPIRDVTVLWNGNLKQTGVSTVWLVVPKRFNIDVASRLAFDDIEFIQLDKDCR